MFKALALIAATAYANTNADDTTGLFPGADQWKTGLVSIDSHNDDMFYWVF